MPVTPFIGYISLWGLNFVPRGWASCDGQTLPISQHTALFALIGTTYGGDARTTFALPDLRGRAAMGSGQGAGLSSYRLGAKAGQEGVSLTTQQIPSHTHGVTIPVSQNTFPNATDDNTGFLQDLGSRPFYSSTVGSGAMKGPELATAGAGQAHENRQPYLALNYCIALQGVFPMRS